MIIFTCNYKDDKTYIKLVIFNVLTIYIHLLILLLNYEKSKLLCFNRMNNKIKEVQ